MVLESLLTRREALKHPFFILFASVLICSVSLWTTYLAFPGGEGDGTASMLSLAFVTIALTPLFHAIFKAEEEKEAERPGFAALFLARHFNIVKLYAFFFIGIILTYAFWYSFVSPDVRGVMFANQENALSNIGQLRESLTGNVSGASAACGQQPFCWFSVIFSNNAFRVLTMGIFLSFVYGAGAIFLLGWNASVLGVLIGKDIVYFSLTHGGLAALWMALNRALGLVPHGIFESMGYFVGAIAGGIIGAAMSKQRHLRGEVGMITKDVIVMLLYAFGLLAIGALIEAYVIVASI